MDDLEKYIQKRKDQNPQFKKGYENFKIGVLLRQAREEAGITQEDLARKVGVRRETIVFLEKGKYNPSLKLAFQIAKALKSSVEELFSFDDKKI